MSTKIKITKHALIRSRQRIGIKRKNLLINSKKAFKKGLILSDVSKNKFLTKYFYTYNKNIVKKYYEGYIYVFNKNSKNLITVIKIDNQKSIEELNKIFFKKLLKVID